MQPKVLDFEILFSSDGALTTNSRVGYDARHEKQTDHID